MKEHQQPRRRSWPRAFGWCSKEDVVIAFKAVGQEIRAKHQRLNPETLTLAEACRLAGRIKDQRDLIRQIAERRNRKHARRLMRLNRKHREKLIKVVEEAGLDPSVLLFK